MALHSAHTVFAGLLQRMHGVSAVSNCILRNLHCFGLLFCSDMGARYCLLHLSCHLQDVCNNNSVEIYQL